MNELISRRLKSAREKLGLNQAELAERLGFNDRQTLAAIEAGQRKLSADELLRAIQILGVDVDYFTDSFRLAGEGRFSWRAGEEASNEGLQQFEDRAGRWIATYRRLGEMQGITVSPLQMLLSINEKSSYEDARAAAEALVQEWKLGDVPAVNLESAIQEFLGALVLYVDAPKDVSGAACQLPGLSTILINRHEPEGRRHYDLAHECFHLLTWERMPPDHTEKEKPRSGKAKRVEQLANNFASALLLPEHSLTSRWKRRENCDLHDWLNETASAMLVTAQALKWRIVQLGWFRKIHLEEIDDSRLVANGRPEKEQTVPRLFGEVFMKRIHVGLENGQLSVRRAAALLGLMIEDLGDLFRDYALSVPFEI